MITIKGNYYYIWYIFPTIEVVKSDEKYAIRLTVYALIVPYGSRTYVYWIGFQQGGNFPLVWAEKSGDWNDSAAYSRGWHFSSGPPLVDPGQNGKSYYTATLWPEKSKSGFLDSFWSQLSMLCTAKQLDNFSKFSPFSFETSHVLLYKDTWLPYMVIITIYGIYLYPTMSRLSNKCWTNARTTFLHYFLWL